MHSLRHIIHSTFADTALITLFAALSLSIPLAASPALVSGSVTIAWDPNPEPDVIGYRVHYGSESGAYTEVIDVGPCTAFEITGLIEAQGYFCSVTAYNTYGMDSDFAEELVIYNVPGLDPPIVEQEFRINRMTLGTDQMVTFEVSGMIGNIVEVWASHDLADWTLIDTLIDVSGPITVEDPAAKGQPQRFYRLGIP